MNIQELDRTLFQLINGAHTPWADNLMWLFSTRWFFIPLYLLLGWLVYRKFSGKLLIILVAVALMILVSDQLSVSVKFLVSRLRPCHDSLLASQVHLVNNHCGGTFGFYSSHASNTSALVVFMGLLFDSRKYFGLLAFWSFWVGFSRIYLGNHFPADIIVGWISGAAIGWLSFTLLRRFLT
jgi:undecaprenyl-diphosphatase